MLHINRSIPPVAHKHSCNLFHMRDKVAHEIERLEKQGVIEKVSGPTEKVSRIVTHPKQKSPGEIQLSVDMRDANQAILRTRHITPTINELTTDLNSATVFFWVFVPVIISCFYTLHADTSLPFQHISPVQETEFRYQCRHRNLPPWDPDRDSRHPRCQEHQRWHFCVW